MRKIGKFVVFIILILNLIPIYSFAEDKPLTDPAEKAKLFEKLLLYHKDDEMSFIDECLPRENLAAIMATFFGVNRESPKGSESATVYSDVEKSRWSFEAISVVSDQGILTGYTDHRFYPEEFATTEQAAKAIVVALGYDINAQGSGGTYEGFWTTASKIGLLDGVTSSRTDALTKGEFTKMLYNALNVDVIVETYKNGKINYEKKAGCSFLNQYFDIYKVKGIVNATDVTAVSGIDVAEQGCTVVNDDTYYNGDINTEEYIGMYAEVYYKHNKDSDINTIISITSESRNNILRISSNDIISDKSENEIKYYYNKSNRTARLCDDITVIYNGKRVDFYDSSYFCPSNGNVTLIDNNDDGIYEIVIIKNYINYWVKKVYDADGMITITDKRKDTAPLKFDLEDTEIKYRFFSNGAASDFSKIKNSSVISVMCDGMTPDGTIKKSTYYEILISDVTVTGTASSYNLTDHNVFIDSKEYDLSPAYNNDLYGVKTGAEAKFYLDAFGKIFVCDSSDTYMYGFLVDIYIDDTGDKYFAKIFNENNEFKTYKIADRIVIDTTAYKAKNVQEKMKEISTVFFSTTGASKMENASGYQQLVKFKVNAQDELNALDTIVQNYTDSEAEKNYLRFFINTNEKISMSTYAKASYFNDYKNNVGTPSDMINFMIPQDASDSYNYTAITLEELKSIKTINPVCFFDVDDVGCAAVALQIGQAQRSVDDYEVDNIMVVGKVSEIWDDKKGEIITTLNGNCLSMKNSEISLVMSDERAMNGIKVNPGDIVSWSKNNTGEATLIRKVMGVHDDGDLITDSNPTTPLNKEDRVSLAYVADMSDLYWRLKYGGSENREETTQLSSVERIFTVDTSGRKLTIKKGSLSDIKTANDFGAAEASRVFIVSRYNRPVEVVIYNS